MSAAAFGQARWNTQGRQNASLRHGFDLPYEFNGPLISNVAVGDAQRHRARSTYLYGSQIRERRRVLGDPPRRAYAL
jgi:hypothetical protein